LERAVDLFRQGKLEQAVAMRKLAEEAREAVVPKLEQRIKEHKREHPSTLDGKEPA
jgi:hypothetical protein